MDINHPISLPHSKGSGQTIEFIFTFMYTKQTHPFSFCVHYRRVRQFVLVYYSDTINNRNVTKKGMHTC